MNINVTNGVRKIVLTKSERSALERSRDICKELSKQWGNGESQIAEKAETWLIEVLNCIPESKSVPEAATK